MAVITICPKCQASIQVSDEHSDPSAEFRCPKCQALFPLHQALDIMAESPPEAAPLARPSSTEAPAADAPAGSPFTVAAPHADRPKLPTQFTSSLAANEVSDRRPALRMETSGEQSPAARRKKPQASMFWNVFGVVGGGAAGVYVAALALHFMGYPVPDPINKLPGLPNLIAMVDGAAQPGEDEIPPPTAPSTDPTAVAPPPAGEEPPLGRDLASTPSAEPLTPPPATIEETPPAAPTGPVIPPSPVQGAPKATLDELGQLLGETHRATGGQVGRSTGPVLMDDAAYEKLCQTAQAAAFVHAAPQDPLLVGKRSAIRSVMRRLTDDAGVYAELGERGADRVAKGPHLGGVVVVGTVKSIEQQGPLLAVTIEHSSRRETTTVMCLIRNQLREGKRFAVLGALVDSPASNLDGYTGSLPRVIWMGYPVEVN